MFSVCKVLELDDNAAKETPEISRAKAIDPNGLMGADTHKISKTGLGQVTAQNHSILMDSSTENVSQTDTHKISKPGLGQVTAENLQILTES